MQPDRPGGPQHFLRAPWPLGATCSLSPGPHLALRELRLQRHLGWLQPGRPDHMLTLVLPERPACGWGSGHYGFRNIPLSGEKLFAIPAASPAVFQLSRGCSHVSALNGHRSALLLKKQKSSSHGHSLLLFLKMTSGCFWAPPPPPMPKYCPSCHLGTQRGPGWGGKLGDEAILPAALESEAGEG